MTGPVPFDGRRAALAALPSMAVLESPPDLYDWRESMLGSVLRATSALGVVLSVLGVVALGTSGWGIRLGIACVLLVFLAMVLPRDLYAWRVGLLIACLYGLGSVTVLRIGPLAGPSLCYALVVLCGAVFVGVRTAIALLVVTTVSIVGAGLLVVRGIAPPLFSAALAFDEVPTWVRSSIAFMCLAGVMATTASVVLGRIESTLADRSAALRRLERERVEHESTELSLRATEIALRHSQKMEALGQLAGGVAHDFNNLLTVILGHADEVASRVDGDPKLRQDVGAILQSASQAAELTRQLLTFSRRGTIERVVFDLNERVVSTERMLQRLLGENIDLRLDLEPDLATVRTDPGHIDQVLVNLVVNARDAMPAGGRVTISTARALLDAADLEELEVPPGRYVRLSVADSGEGIPAEILGRILEPFFTTKRSGEGTGLGLSTVYGIVKQSGGGLRVSTNPPAGSCFDVFLPECGEEAFSESIEPLAPIPGEGTVTILVVEDDAAVRELVVQMLDGLGYSVLVAQNGREGLDVANGVDRIDALLTDVRMPIMGGPELAAAVRRRHPDIRVLFMSGYPDEGGGAPTPELEYFLPKPFRRSDLVAALERALRLDHAGRARPLELP